MQGSGLVEKAESSPSSPRSTTSSALQGKDAEGLTTVNVCSAGSIYSWPINKVVGHKQDD